MLYDLGAKNVAMAKDGQEALEAVRKGGIDVVISGITMRHINGIELHRILRCEQSTSDIPFVMVKFADDSSELVEEAASTGATLTKVPLDLELLNRKLAEALPRPTGR